MRSRALLPTMLLAAMCAGQIVADTSPARLEPVKAAFMYSAYNQGSRSFMNEYDAIFAALGWEAEKFENVQAEELSNRLAEFDIVVGSSVSNYENPQDFSPHADKWLAFLEGGGVVVCTDASYPQLLRQWIGGISPDFALPHGVCASHSRPSDATRAVTVADDDPLLTTPNDLRSLLRDRPNWGHMVDVGEPWRTPVRCFDGETLLAYRPVGSGLLLITSHFRMNQRTAQILGRELLENALAYAQCLRMGVELSSLELGQNRPGANAATAVLRSVGEARAVGLRLSLRHGEDNEWTPGAEATVSLPAEARVEMSMSFRLDERGPYAVALTLADADGAPFYTTRRAFVLPEAVEFDVWPRHYYPHNTTVRPTVRLLPDEGVDLPQTRLEAYLAGPDAAGETVVLEGPGEEIPLELALAGLPPGEYAVTGRLLRGDEEVAAGRLPIHLHPRPRVWFDERNVTHVDDEPFFPLGFYMVTWTFDKQDVSRFLNALAEAGFNLAHIGARNLDDFEELLDEAHRLGLRVIVEGLQNMRTVERFHDHPAVIAWNSGDEPDGRGVPPETVAANIDRIKTISPDRVVYTTLCVPDEYANYAPWIEVLSVDPYPVHRNAVNLKRVAESVALARETVRDDKPLWVVPQAFGGYGAWAVPTPAQARNMTYQSLIEGAVGLVYYTYRDGSFHMEDHPELWDAMKRIAVEVRELMPVLMGPAHLAERFQTGPDDVVRCLAVERDGHLTLLAVNASEEDLGEIELRAAGLPAEGRAEALFEDRTVEIREGAIRDAFGPAAVRVYRLPLGD